MDQIQNFAIGQLLNGITAAATSAVVASGQGARFPDPADGEYNVVIWDTLYNSAAEAYWSSAAEIVRVTAKSTDTFTITRAQESTTARAFNVSGHSYNFELNATTRLFDLITYGGPSGAAFGTSTPYTLGQLFLAGDPQTNALGAGTAFSADTLYAVPTRLYSGQVIDRIAMQKNQTTPTPLALAGIYSDLKTSRYPDALVASGEAVTFGGSHAGIEYWDAGDLPYTVPSTGIYWVVFQANGTTPQIPKLNEGEGTILGFVDPGTTNPTVSRAVGISVASTYDGSLPTTFPSGGAIITSGGMPAIFLRFSSVTG